MSLVLDDLQDALQRLRVRSCTMLRLELSESSLRDVWHWPSTMNGNYLFTNI